MTHLERTDTGGAIFTHGHLITTTGGRYPLALTHEDWEALETALNRDGICGDEAPKLRRDDCGIPDECQLRHGHASEWHQGRDSHRWRSGAERVKRDAVVEAARAWVARQRRYDGQTLTGTAADLIAAVDALDGAS